jgi:hypothetical protein
MNSLNFALRTRAGSGAVHCLNFPSGIRPPLDLRFGANHTVIITCPHGLPNPSRLCPHKVQRVARDLDGRVESQLS